MPSPSLICAAIFSRLLNRAHASAKSREDARKLADLMLQHMIDSGCF